MASGHEVQSLLFVLEGALADAALGLALYEEARSRPRERPRWMGRDPARRAIELEMEVQLSPQLTPQQLSEARSQISIAADLQARRQEWAAGRMPESYESRLVFIHAHTVLYALDSIGKTLNALAGMAGMPAGARAASEGYRDALPDLVKVRDSAHHQEDRAQGLDRNHQPLTLQPVVNEIVSAPGGGVLVLSALNGNKLGYTSSDGVYREADISAASVAAAQEAIQRMLDSLPWKGYSRTVPH